MLLYTQDLNHWVAAQDPCLQAVYQGTFARDEFVSHVTYEPGPLYPKAYIVNTDARTQPGTHWISVYRSQPGKVEVFDSYGLPPHHWGTDLAHLLSRIGWGQQQHQDQPLQHPYSTLCGVYCLYMLTSRVQGRSFEDVVSDFQAQDPVVNDAVVLHWYHQRSAPPKDELLFLVHPWTRVLHQTSQPFCPY